MFWLQLLGRSDVVPVPVSDLGRQLEEKWGRKHSGEKAVEKKRPAGADDADADPESGSESPEH
jgi:hypothetical protein